MLHSCLWPARLQEFVSLEIRDVFIPHSPDARHFLQLLYWAVILVGASVRVECVPQAAPSGGPRRPPCQGPNAPRVLASTSLLPLAVVKHTIGCVMSRFQRVNFGFEAFAQLGFIIRQVK